VCNIFFECGNFLAKGGGVPQPCLYKIRNIQREKFKGSPRTANYKFPRIPGLKIQEGNRCGMDRAERLWMKKIIREKIVHPLPKINLPVTLRHHYPGSL
jgi:hypothetical protein